jgi:hypothetical protein
LGGAATAQIEQAMSILGGGAFPLTQQGCAPMATGGDDKYCNQILGLWQGGWGLCK